MSLGWLVKDQTKGPGLVGVVHSGSGRKVLCADFKHDKVGSPFAGYQRIQDSDLNEMSLYWLGYDPPKDFKNTTTTYPAADCIGSSVEINPLTGQPGTPYP
jgi:hypothetical protein